MPVGNCHLEVFEPRQSSMHGADVRLLPSLAGVDRFLLQIEGELEPDDRQELVWVWQGLPTSTRSEIRNHLILQVRWKVQHWEP